MPDRPVPHQPKFRNCDSRYERWAANYYYKYRDGEHDSVALCSHGRRLQWYLLNWQRWDSCRSMVSKSNHSEFRNCHFGYQLNTAAIRQQYKNG